MISTLDIQMRREMGRLDCFGRPIHEGDTIVALENGNVDEEFIVRYGPCGGVQNVPGEVGYIGFYFECTNPAMRRNGIRQDPLYFLNNYLCKITKTGRDPIIYVVRRDKVTRTPEGVWRTFLVDVLCGRAIVCGTATEDTMTIEQAAAEQGGFGRMPVSAVALEDCFLTYDAAAEAAGKEIEAILKEKRRRETGPCKDRKTQT